MTAAQANLWADVQGSALITRCRCALRPAMTHPELVALGGGCRMPAHACPTLDKYRRLTPRPSLDTE